MEYVFIKRQLKKGMQKKEGTFESISSVTQSFKKKKLKFTYKFCTPSSITLQKTPTSTYKDRLSGTSQKFHKWVNENQSHFHVEDRAAAFISALCSAG